jgi:hypothetical protein
MPVLLTNPYTPEGVTDPAQGAPRAKITFIQISLDGADNPGLGKGIAKYVAFKTEFGDVDVDGIWEQMPKTGHRTHHLQYDHFVDALQATTTAEEGHNVYAGIKRYLWEWLQAEDPVLFGGTIE